MAKTPAMVFIAAVAFLAALVALSTAGLASARPFPFHTTLPPGVIKPTNVSQAQMDAAIRRHYNAWKTNYLRNLGAGDFWVKKDNTNTTVSEAHGYGMVLAAYMADKAIFDSMFRYFRAHPSNNAPHLMAWKQTLKNGQMVDIEGVNSATDGDLDIAYSLLLAHVQWGSSGAITYKSEALKILHDILAHEVNTATWTLTPGDWASGAHANHTRPSDFMSGHFLAFARADVPNADKWRKIYASVSKIVNYQFQHGSQNTGLMPDFMVRSGSNFLPVPGTYLESPHDGDFYYNACRTPWRLTMSYILQGKTDMLAVLRKQTGWIKTKAAGIPANIRAGYFVRNGVNGQSFSNFDDLPFTAPFAVNAMVGVAGGQTWLNRLWTSIAGGDYGLNQGYYGDTIRLQVMLTVAGDSWQP
ncbi:MAG: glycosyl hydrolase family 8 [Beijerinckiaceae bacterium]|nr:glycosyl hydrolase family 8 [Beijerinckiaceae bacterium]MCI0735977.1 glycosyl hydrolase family 8 [Beijerinckiaceae bacterium]